MLFEPSSIYTAQSRSRGHQEPIKIAVGLVHPGGLVNSDPLYRKWLTELRNNTNKDQAHSIGE